LALLVVPAGDTTRLHPAILTALGFSGLDVVELRAVHAALPDAFANDADGRKAKWRDALEARLKELTAKEAAGALTANQRRHPCYAALAPSGLGPLDPDAELQAMQAVASTAFEPVETPR
jgi:hypothetical protein